MSGTCVSDRPSVGVGSCTRSRCGVCVAMRLCFSPMSWPWLGKNSKLPTSIARARALEHGGRATRRPEALPDPDALITNYDGGPKGCKGYLEEVYNIIKATDPASPIRMCTCAKDRAAAKARKSARTERAKSKPPPARSRDF
eukprot:scaffold2762_cov95-Isochrysis_galbana.AAC.1